MRESTTQDFKCSKWLVMMVNFTRILDMTIEMELDG